MLYQVKRHQLLWLMEPDIQVSFRRKRALNWFRGGATVNIYCLNAEITQLLWKNYRLRLLIMNKPQHLTFQMHFWCRSLKACVYGMWQRDKAIRSFWLMGNASSPLSTIVDRKCHTTPGILSTIRFTPSNLCFCQLAVRQVILILFFIIQWD